MSLNASLVRSEVGVQFLGVCSVSVDVCGVLSRPWYMCIELQAVLYVYSGHTGPDME